MSAKHVVLTLALGAGMLAAPVAVSADDRGPMMGGSMMGGGMMGGSMMGSGMMGGMDADDLFAEIDADKDGKITAAEVQAYRKAQVAGLDADGDNLISVEELTAYMTAKMESRVADMAKARIEASDLDGDGKLSAEEMMAPPMPVRLFDKLDTDGDGAVTKEEAEAFRDKLKGMVGRRGDDDRRGHWMKHRGMSRDWGGDDKE